MFLFLFLFLFFVFIYCLVDTILQKKSKMSDKFESPNFTHAISTLSLLIRGSIVQLDEEDDEDDEQETDNPYALPGPANITPNHVSIFLIDEVSELKTHQKMIRVSFFLLLLLLLLLSLGNLYQGSFGRKCCFFS